MHYSVKIRSVFVALVCASATWSFPALATDALVEGAKLCTRQLPHYEREYGIPTHLLSAIASTESGRYHEGLGLKLPWPWTINVEGKGYFFETKQEAIAAVRKYQLRGIQSIDVGCMQVNLYHHAGAFSSLDEAFEPKTNVAYAAGFLRGLYQEGGSWKKAASDYHSRTPALGKEYAGLVYTSWYQILDKLRQARLQVPTDAQQAAAESDTQLAMNEAPAPYIRNTESLLQEKPKPKALPGQSFKTVSAFHSPHMKVIQTGHKDTTREHGIIVVRPQTTPQVTIAQAKPIPEASVISNPAIIPVSSQMSPDSSPRKSGPNFIFSD